MPRRVREATPVHGRGGASARARRRVSLHLPPWVKKFSTRVSDTPPSLGCKKNSPMKAQKNMAKFQQSPHGKISAGGKSLIRLGAGQKREPHARPAAYTSRPRAQDAPQRTRSGGAGNCRPCVYALLRAHRGRGGAGTPLYPVADVWGRAAGRGGARTHGGKFLPAKKCRHAHNARAHTRAGRGHEERAQ